VLCMSFVRQIRSLLVNFFIWLLGLVWIYNPILSMEVLLHETGHTILALSTGSTIVGFDLSPPRPHVTIDYYSVAARNIALTGGFFFPYLIVFVFFVLRKSKIANFIIWPLFATFPSSWLDFRDLGLLISCEITSLVQNLGPLFVFFLLNHAILIDITKRLGTRTS